MNEIMGLLITALVWGVIVFYGVYLLHALYTVLTR
jgi:hypothetical protein